MDGRWVSTDRVMSMILGRTRPELVGTTLIGVTHPEDVPAELEQLERIRNHEIDAYHLEKRVLHKSGREVWVSQIVWYVGDGGGEPGQLRCQIKPWTAAEEPPLARDDTDSELRALFAVLPELVVVRHAGRVAHANGAAVRALGYERAEDIVGRPFIDLIAEDDRARFAANEAAEVGQVRWLRRDGSSCTTETWTAQLGFDERASVVVVGRDITEKNEIQAQLLRADRMAALGTLAAGVAHEINNPLTYLLVNVEHVLRRLRALAAVDDVGFELAGEKGKDRLQAFIKSLSHAVEGAVRVRAIVGDLMRFSRGNVESRGLVDLRGVLESSIHMAWHEIRHRARLVKNLAEVPPVEANEALLGQVFLNLLVNAAQAIPETGEGSHELRVSTSIDDDGNVVVEVADTGVGIEPHVLPRIFDPFFTTKATGVGTGLGLSISHGTIKSIGGDIQVESTPGKGSTFRVVVPAAKGWRRGTPKSGFASVKPSMRGKILVIDDEPLVSDAIAAALSDDHDVVGVTAAHDALDLVRAGESFDLIVCDLVMPTMSGMDLYADIVRIAPNVAGQLVFMTGGAFTPRARAFLESVQSPCLEKPIDMSKLRSLIAKKVG